MNKKISLGISLAITLLAVTVTFAVTMSASKNIYNKIITNLSLRTSASAAIDEINEIVSGYFFGSVDDKTAEVTASIVEGYINGLDDAQSRYLSAEEYAEREAKLDGRLQGIGVDVYFDSTSSSLIVTYVYPDSPAATAGLQKGDEMVGIGGETVTKKNYEDLIKELFGGKLSSVEVTYIRGGKETTVQPMLGFHIPSVSFESIDGAAVIRISAFCRDTPELFSAAIASAREVGATGFVIDLRGTWEGTLEYAAKTLDVIVPAPSGSRNLAATYDKKGARVDVFTAESGAVNAVFAVIIDGDTAGPAELFACDLRDIGSASLVGTRTKGVGTDQKVFPLENGDAVLLTVARIEPYEPESAYDGTGLEPTVPCESGIADQSALRLLDNDQDEQLKAALKLMP